MAAGLFSESLVRGVRVYVTLAQVDPAGCLNNFRHKLSEVHGFSGSSETLPNNQECLHQRTRGQPNHCRS